MIVCPYEKIIKSINIDISHRSILNGKKMELILSMKINILIFWAEYNSLLYKIIKLMLIILVVIIIDRWILWDYNLTGFI